LRAGGGAAAALNAANEVAVEAFLAGRIGFLDIAGIVEDVVGRIGNRDAATLEDVFSIDADARRAAEDLVVGWASAHHFDTACRTMVG
jgi:1-deoxy-D-xylulose-5-phosphate reductoisomerase